MLYLFQTKEDKLERYINAIIMHTFFCFSVIEILSFMNQLHAKNLQIVWCCMSVISIGILLYRYVLKKRKIRFMGTFSWWIAGEIIFSLSMLVIALCTKPYNWDSMTYHLPRIVHWLQNGSVAHYATHIERQVASPVLSEFTNTHVYSLINQQDSILNLLQTTSFLTNGILIYGITRRLSCSSKYCRLAMILFYTTPIAFGEALTTQVDQYATLWLLCFTYLFIDYVNKDHVFALCRETALKIVSLSLCIALGYLTKPSIGIAMMILALWLLIMIIVRKDKFGVVAVYFFLALSVIVVVIAPEIIRNIETFGAISSPVAGKRQLIGSLHLKHIVVNFFKNFTFNLPAIWIYDSKDFIYRFVVAIAAFLEIDINNPAIAEDGTAFLVHNVQDYGHDTAVNPILGWLFIVVIFLFLFGKKKGWLREIKNQYFMVAGASFIVFCCILRWEPFVSRYMISYFAFLCPAVAGQIELFCKERKKIEIGLLSIIGLLCITELFGMYFFHGRIAFWQNSYFYHYSDIENDYIETAEIINENQYQKIGLLIGGNTYEYPLEALLDYDAQVEHINVENATAKYEKSEFIPDVIITRDYNLEEKEIVYHMIKYQKSVKINDDYYLMTKVE